MDILKTEAFVELILKVFSDPVPEKYRPTIMYLFGQTSDNEGSVICRAVEMWKAGDVKQILVPRCSKENFHGCEEFHGYPGFNKWSAKLLKQGIPEYAITSIQPSSSTGVNTLIEAEGLIHYLKDTGITSIYITAAPFHQTRAFLTTVKVLQKSYPKLRVYNRVGGPLDWQTKVRHSQGTTVGTRREIFYGEINRIRCYQSRGDIASAEEGLRYLDERNPKGG